MMNEEGIGVIEEKTEQLKKNGIDQHWKFKIVLDGAQNPLTFSLWDYDAGTKVKVGEQIKFYWSEKPGKGFEGKDVTYRNIQSIGTPDKYDPNLPKSDKELAKQAPKESMKDVAHKEKVEGIGVQTGGVPQSYQERESRRQRMIVRQSALNYSTQLESIFLTWELRDKKFGGNLDVEHKLFQETKKRIKATAKEFEDNVMRLENE